MKSVFKYIIILSLLSAPAYLRADFDDTGAGARAMAMGNSFTALSDDVFGMYYNPAGLGFVQTAQVGADLGKLYFGLDDNSDLLSGFTGIALPIIKVNTTDAVAVSSGTSPGAGRAGGPVVVTYRHLGTFGLGVKYFSLTDSYRESAYYLSYGRSVSNRLAWGVSAKYLQEKYVMDDYLRASPVFDYGNKDSVSNVSVDAGLLYNIAPRLFAGVSVLDINQPNLGLKYEDLLPCTVRTGIAWKEKGLSWAFDAVLREKEWIYSTGFEKYIRDVFGVRMGVGYGGSNYFNIAGGFSIKLSRVQFDYVFQYPVTGITDISGTHRVSIIFRFGRKMKDELEPGSLEYYYERAKDDVASLSQQLADTKTEKNDLEKILIEESSLRVKERIKAAKAEAISAQSSTAAVQPADKDSKEVRHIVRDGETLKSIAQKYFGDEKYWNDIYLANKDTVERGGALRVSQVLIIPALSPEETPVTPAVTAAPAAPAAPQASPSPAKKAAEQSAVRPAAASPAPVKVIPIKALEPENVPEEATVPASKKPAAETQPPSKPKKHVVKEGENLRNIAQKYYNDPKRWKDIYKANKDKIISGQLTPGQEITIP